MIAVIDYGIGNLKSVVKAFQYLEIPVRLTASRRDIEKARGVVLPGVGAFGEGMRNLQQREMVSLLKDLAAGGVPLLGICLGMQLLFAESAESPGVSGLGLVDGRVERFKSKEVNKIPHMGWNQVRQCQQDPLFKGVKDNSYFYFVHSYYVDNSDSEAVLGTTCYGDREFISVVHRKNIWGFQCHPEKSSDLGLLVLKNFSEVIANGSNTCG